MKNQFVDKLKKISRSKLMWILASVLLFLWANNTSLFVNRTTDDIKLLAHAALGQTYDLTGVQWDTNTAAIIDPPEHPYIENTIPSIRAAFGYGADVVEFDLRLTEDNQLAVFHDYLLDYRTNGEGLVSEHTMAELKSLDVGYGYTADEGKTYPLRGTGVGLMVTLEDVLEEFPEQQFLIHIKDDGEAIGPILLAFFSTIDESTLSNIALYGNDQALDLIKEEYPDMMVLSKNRMIKALLWYQAVGWTGYVPQPVRNMELHLPLKYARVLWGWPDKFLQRMERANSRVILLRYENGWSDGFDSPEDLELLPAGYSGGVWTNRIDLVGPALDP